MNGRFSEAGHTEAPRLHRANLEILLAFNGASTHGRWACQTQALKPTCIMAIWQFTFYPVPRAAIERIDGVTALTIAAFKPVNLETYDENAEWPNYWEGRSPKSYADDVGALLPARESWSPDGLMFGDDKADDIDLWDDDFRVRLEIRHRPCRDPSTKGVISELRIHERSMKCTG